MTGRVIERRAELLAHPDGARFLSLHLVEFLEGGGRRTLTGVLDGRMSWRDLPDDEEPDPRDGICLSAEWMPELRECFAPSEQPAPDPGPVPTPTPSHTAEEIAALRAELEEWRAELSSFVDVDRARVDRLIDGIRCQP